MKRLTALLALSAGLFLLPSDGFAQTIPVGYVQVTSSNLSAAGVPITNATISWTPVNNSGVLLPGFHVGSGSGGHEGSPSITAPVTAGAFTVTVPDSVLATPQNVCYAVAVISNASGNPLIKYPCVQPAASGTAATGASAWCSSSTRICNFDNYLPSLPALVVQTMGPTGPTGPTGPAGGGSVGDSDVANQIASQGSVNLVGTVPSTGKYRITYYASQHALCGTGLNAVLFTFNWNDGINARTANSVALSMGSSQSPASGSIQGAIPMYAAASTAITYTSTVVGSCATGGPSSYDAHIAVESVQ